MRVTLAQMATSGLIFTVRRYALCGLIVSSLHLSVPLFVCLSFTVVDCGQVVQHTSMISEACPAP